MSDHTTKPADQQPKIDGFTPYFPPDLENYAPWVAQIGLLAPYGDCQCRCGQKVGLALRHDPRRGLVKGMFNTYLLGHRAPYRRGEIGPNPSGKCMCGCGSDAPIALQSDTSLGHIKGQPIRFIHGHRPLTPVEKRFWAKVDKRGPNDCWEWQGVIGEKGYGKFRIGDRMITASRVAWELTNGPIKDGLWVLHNCPSGDNPSCVNPAHLWLGNVQDNMDDMIAKGRDNRKEGESHGRAQFTHEQVRNLREQFASLGLSYAKFAELHNISTSNLHRIITGQTYKNA